jgi:hypothetical protein
MVAEISTEFDPPADNWRGKNGPDGKPYAYPDQWHLKVSPKEETASVRYLAIIETHPKSASADAFHETQLDDGAVHFGDWRVVAELDAAKPASLMIKNDATGTVLASEAGALPKGREVPNRTGENASVLVERVDGQQVTCMTLETPPVAARR